MNPYSEFERKVKDDIRSEDYIQKDLRFNRETQSKIGYRLKIPEDILIFLRNENPLPKYRDDWQRMRPSFDSVVKEVSENPDSRQLIILNTSDFSVVKPCFLSIQFLKSKTGKYNALVYQRSSDVSKLKDDLTFFIYVMKKFEQSTSLSTDELTVVYGNIHFTKEESNTHMESF